MSELEQAARSFLISPSCFHVSSASSRSADTKVQKAAAETELLPYRKLRQSIGGCSDIPEFALMNAKKPSSMRWLRLGQVIVADCNRSRCLKGFLNDLVSPSPLSHPLPVLSLIPLAPPHHPQDCRELESCCQVARAGLDLNFGGATV